MLYHFSVFIGKVAELATLQFSGVCQTSLCLLVGISIMAVAGLVRVSFFLKNCCIYMVSVENHVITR